jgi:hypothetical protein
VLKRLARSLNLVVMRQESNVDSRRRVSFFALSALCASKVFAAEGSLSREDLFKELARLIPPDTISGHEVFESHGFHLEFDRYKQLGEGFKPNGDEFQSVFVSAPGAFKTHVAKGVSPTVANGVSIYHRDSGVPLLAFSDSDGDGRPDFLTYSTVDENGKVIMDVTDYEADGQPDLRINFAERYLEIWHADRWYRVENKEGRRGIELNGEFVELRREKNRYYVP